MPHNPTPVIVDIPFHCDYCGKLIPYPNEAITEYRPFRVYCDVECLVACHIEETLEP